MQLIIKLNVLACSVCKSKYFNTSFFLIPVPNINLSVFNI